MKTKKLLIVEDNKDDIELVLLSLQKKNIDSKVDVVTDGVLALDFLFCKNEYKYRSIEDLPDLVLLDLQLPNVSGLEVLEQIRSHEPTKFLPVTIFTTSNMESDIRNSYKLGANSYIRKPVDFDCFQSTIEFIGKYWLGLNEKLQYKKTD